MCICCVKNGSRATLNDMQRAYLSQDEVVTIVERLYGLQVTSSSELNSYDDLNLHVQVSQTHWDNSNIPKVSPDGYVLKILNSLDSTKQKFIDAMHAAIFRCYDAGIPTPRPVPNKNGDYFTFETLSTRKGSDGNAKEAQQFIVRLFEYIPGELLRGKRCTPELCYSVGEMAAKVDKALMDFHHPGYEGHARHWCLTKVEFLLDKIDAVDNAENRQLVRNVVHQFKSDVVENYHKLQKGIIHGDLNDGNLLVKQIKALSSPRLPRADATTDQTEDEIYCVSGVLDFGDSVYRYHVFDIAIAVMYILTQNDRLDPVDVAGITLSGYLRHLELPAFDLSVLKECICGRFAQSLVYGAYEHQQNPSNMYVLETAKSGWTILKHLWRIPKKDLYRKWQIMLKKFNIDKEFGNDE